MSRKGRKINIPDRSLDLPELRVIVDRLKRKEPELEELVRQGRKRRKRKPKA